MDDLNSLKMREIDMLISEKHEKQDKNKEVELDLYLNLSSLKGPLKK